jgi:hypothetical protein
MVDCFDFFVVDLIALPGGVFSKDSFKRELNKAFLGFSCDTHGKSIATGFEFCYYPNLTKVIGVAELLAEIRN